MQYDLKIEDVSDIRRRLHFTLAAGVVKGEMDRAYLDLKNRVRIPGFRRGKVPRNLLEARFGRQIKGEVAGKLIEETYQRAATDLAVAGQPAVEERSDIASGAPFTFTIGVDVKPQVQIEGYRGITVEYVAAEVTDDDVERFISQRLASRGRIAEVKDDRPVTTGDFALTEIELRDGDEVVATEAGTMVNTAAERYYVGIEPLIVGARPGEERTGRVQIAATSMHEHLRGRELDAKVKVVSIQSWVVPELSDDSAKELGFEGGVEGMRAGVRLQIEQQAQEAGRNDARVKLLQKLVDLNKFDVPQGMVDEQLQGLVEEMKVRRAYGGQDPRSIKFSEAEMADLRSRARFAARAAVVLAAIARQESIDAADADIQAKIAEIAAVRGQAAAAIRGYLEREDALGVLRDRILEEKTLEWLLENADLRVVSAAEAQAAAPVVALAVEAAPAEPAPVAQAAPAEEPAAAAPAEQAPEAQAAPAEEAPAAASWNASMKKGELLDIAKGMGLDVNSKSTKADILAALEAAG